MTAQVDASQSQPQKPYNPFGKATQTSERESRLSRSMLLTMIGLGVILFLGVRFLYFSNFAEIERMGQRPMPTATVPAVADLPTEESTATPTATQWPTPIILEREVIREVPIEVTREVSVYRDVMVEVEVTKLVTQPVMVLQSVTPTPVPLAPGTVEICASVEGATAIYIGDTGVVSGECKKFSFGVGQTSIPVKINR